MHRYSYASTKANLSYIQKAPYCSGKSVTHYQSLKPTTSNDANIILNLLRNIIINKSYQIPNFHATTIWRWCMPKQKLQCSTYILDTWIDPYENRFLKLKNLDTCYVALHKLEADNTSFLQDLHTFSDVSITEMQHHQSNIITHFLTHILSRNIKTPLRLGENPSSPHILCNIVDPIA